MPSGSGFVHGMGSLGGEPVTFAPWDALPDAVVVTRPNGTVTFANQAADALFGWTSVELVGQPVDVLVTESHRPLVATGAGWREVTARHRGGDEVPVELWVAEQAGNVVVVLRDRRGALAAADEAARTASHRQQADRLDGLAELAGSLAHEFNNLLAVVLSSVGFVTEAVGDQPAVAPDLERIRDAAERGARLTRHLLGATGGEPARGSVDVGALVDDVGRIVEWGTRGDVRVRATPGLPPVVGDRRELEELLLSLVLDPDASTDVGRAVTLATSRVDLGVVEAAALDVPAGPYVELAVGCRATVFATTAAYRLARRNGGALVLGSEVIRLLLPMAGAEVPVAHEAPERRTVVLVVDDTEALRELTARALQKHGYAVLEAGSGAEALRLVDTNEVDLVLTDVVMPRMSGLELHDTIGAMPTPPPVVFMSGYSDAVLPEGPDVAPVLRKPFSEQDLLEHVRAGVSLERKAGS
ncbi:MAG: putative multi-sensor signal transduction histidine kinase [Actinomycetia bacterium]|nr:putative multi-sensor signal transduction histidine kinase [Actinomycetes bacterium]